MIRNVKRLVSRGSPAVAVDDDESMSWDGTDDSSEFLRDECSACDDAMPNLEKLEHICNIFEKGVNMTRRTYYIGIGYKGGPVFTGSDAVSFLVDNGYANSRGKALRIGRKMAYEFALFHHENCDFDLEDEKNLLYKFISPDQRIISPSKSHDLLTLITIADAFEEGVVVGSNMYKNRTFNNTFVGSNAVTFLVSSQMAKTRQDAVRIGQLIMEKHGVFQHIARKHKFKDKHLLYRFVPQKRRVQTCHINNFREAIPIEETAQNFIEVVKPGNVFSGSQAVDAMVDRGVAVTRSEAVLLGEKLASDLQLFHCVQDREMAFFDRRDIYYEYHEGHNTSPSLQWLDNKVGDEQPRTGDGSEYLMEKLDLVMGIKDSDRKQSTITDRAAKNNEECTAITKYNTHGMTFHISEETVDLEYFVGFGNKSEEGSSSNNGEELPKESSLIDRFGFILENGGDKCDASTVSNDCNDTVKTTEKELSIEEWRALLHSCTVTGSGETLPASHNRVKRMMRIGLPDSLRRQAWTAITGVDAIVQERGGDYQSLVETATIFMEDESNALSYGGQSLKGVIERDLHRTFPRHCLFCNDDDKRTGKTPVSSDDIIADVNSAEKFTPDGLASLRRVLYAYSIYDNEVGYCQGMNFLAAMFLTFLSEEESFWLLVVVMNEEPYSMRDIFAEDMAGVREKLYVADKIFQKFLPKLHKHMEKEHVNISMFATQWIMTVFTSTFPFDLVSRVWDSYIVEGWKVVYRVLLSLLGNAQHDLIDLDLEGILTYLRDDFPSKIDCPSIVIASLKIPLRHRHILKYINEWRMGQNGHKHDRRKPSIHSKSVESGGSSSPGMPVKHLTGLQSVGVNGKHIAKKLLPGSRRSSF